MKCLNCGNVIPKEVNFCAYCGYPISAKLIEKKEDGTESYRLPSGKVITRTT